MKKFRHLILSLALFFSVVIPLSSAMAADTFLDTVLDQGGLSTIGKDAYGISGAAPDDVRITVAKIINVFLSFLGIIFVVLIVWSGFEWMTSSGNKEKVDSAISRMKAAVIGLIIILVSWGVTSNIIKALLKATAKV
ncbi:MAG: hypothetical protein WCK11_02165 [Candidatus Falkowbacteria bacterium]